MTTDDHVLLTCLVPRGKAVTRNAPPKSATFSFGTHSRMTNAVLLYGLRFLLPLHVETFYNNTEGNKDEKEEWAGDIDIENPNLHDYT